MKTKFAGTHFWSNSWLEKYQGFTKERTEKLQNNKQTKRKIAKVEALWWAPKLSANNGERKRRCIWHSGCFCMKIVQKTWVCFCSVNPRVKYNSIWMWLFTLRKVKVPKTIASDLTDQGIEITLKPEAKFYVPELLLTPSSDILHPLPLTRLCCYSSQLHQMSYNQF